MNRLVKYAALCGIAAGIATSCIKNEQELCDTYVRFVYDYNIAGADDTYPYGENRFHKQASRVDLFVFDSAGGFVRRLTYDSQGPTFGSDFRITLPRDLPRDAQLVAWANLYEDSYSAPALTPGRSTLGDLAVTARLSDGAVMDREIDPLMHGSILGETKLINYINDEITIYLKKNTNNIRLNLEVINEDNEILDAGDFEFSITVANKEYDYRNNIVSSSDMLEYRPFVRYDDAETGVAAELKLLRLMQDRTAQLVINHTPTGDALLDKDIVPYLLASRLEAFQSMNAQEYLDREDSYNIIVFLKYIQGETPGEDYFVAMHIMINDWVVRLYDEALEPDRE